MSTVMIVDDEHRIRTMLARLLAAEGHTTITVGDGSAALGRLAEREVDLMLLDLAMPRTSGLQVLERLRHREGGPPVIVLSAVEDVAARVQALDLGAADFVGKPFHSAELLARIRRTLAAGPATGTPGGTDDPAGPGRVLEAGGVRLDLERRTASVADDEVTLTAREFALLAHLMRRRGRVCDRQELLHDVWGLDFDPGTNVVEACVRRLRRKLVDPPIETIRSVGYCFNAT